MAWFLSSVPTPTSCLCLVSCWDSTTAMDRIERTIAIATSSLSVCYWCWDLPYLFLFCLHKIYYRRLRLHNHSLTTHTAILRWRSACKLFVYKYTGSGLYIKECNQSEFDKHTDSQLKLSWHCWKRMRKTWLITMCDVLRNVIGEQRIGLGIWIFISETERNLYLFFLLNFLNLEAGWLLHCLGWV